MDGIFRVNCIFSPIELVQSNINSAAKLVSLLIDGFRLNSNLNFIAGRNVEGVLRLSGKNE